MNYYIYLYSTFHDPHFKLKSLLESALPTIKELFDDKTLCCTAPTMEKVLNLLSNDDFEVITSPDIKQLDIYRFALITSINRINDPTIQKILYIDFDRLIHWIHTYPDELRKVLKNELSYDYVHIGRSSRAFETHPSTQKDTESIINKIGSKVLGVQENRDIISVCHLFTEELGKMILSINNFTATGFYGT